MERYGTRILIHKNWSLITILCHCWMGILVSSFAIHNHIRPVVSCLLCDTTATLNQDTVTNIDMKVTWVKSILGTSDIVTIFFVKHLSDSDVVQVKKKTQWWNRARFYCKNESTLKTTVENRFAWQLLRMKIRVNQSGIFTSFLEACLGVRAWKVHPSLNLQ